MAEAEAEAEGGDAERQLTDRCGRRSSVVAWVVVVVVVVKLECEVSNHPARDAFSAALVNGLAVGGQPPPTATLVASCRRSFPAISPCPPLGEDALNKGARQELGQIAAVPRQTWSR
jgi:hypothetical protein